VLKEVINICCLLLLFAFAFLLCSISKCCKQAKQVWSWSVLWLCLFQLAFIALSIINLLYAPTSPLVSLLQETLLLPEILLIVLSFASRAILGLTILILAALTLKRPAVAVAVTVAVVCVLVALLVAFQVLAPEQKGTLLAGAVLEVVVYIMFTLVLTCFGNVTFRMKIAFLVILPFFLIQECLAYKILFLPPEDYPAAQVWLQVADNLAQTCIGNAAFFLLLHVKLGEGEVSNTAHDRSSASADPLLDLEKGESSTAS